jgi:beta-N-acetylhexosaminidase
MHGRDARATIVYGAVAVRRRGRYGRAMHDLEQAAAAMVCVGFDGAAAPPHLRALAARGVRHVILFTRNFESQAQLRDLCAAIDALGTPDRPMLICADQEGGRVQRFRAGFTAIPSMRELGRSCDAAAITVRAAALARELRDVGIHFNLAPVLDVDSNPANPVIGERSLGADPMRVATLGTAFIRGMQSQGVAACAKHFPGHGDTGIDSHFDLPRLAHGRDRLDAIELPPFAAAIRAGVAAIMTAHVVFDALDPGVPATMSRAVIHDLLRVRLGFGGVVVSDDMEMKAIADHFGFEEAIVRGGSAGIDLFLVCHDHVLQHRAIDTLVRATEAGRLARQAISASRDRLAALAKRFRSPP